VAGLVHAGRSGSDCRGAGGVLAELPLLGHLAPGADSPGSWYELAFVQAAHRTLPVRTDLDDGTRPLGIRGIARPAGRTDPCLDQLAIGIVDESREQVMHLFAPDGRRHGSRPPRVGFCYFKGNRVRSSPSTPGPTRPCTTKSNAPL